ncbi:MAG: hypothetical protein EAX95_14915 [Candidatus Thorarchaeota archaeon]|nr:hypothetical protein [Candidatus Thorarchaeota archaeon]
MDTVEIMQIALDMAGLKDIPGDSAIHVPGKDIKKVLIGIDMATAELLLARELGYDLVIAHHPPGGVARINFDQVILLQIDQMIEMGVPPHIAEKAIQGRLETAKNATHVSNYDRIISAAKLLNLPFMNVHLPCDIIARNRFIEVLSSGVAGKELPLVSDAIDIIMDIPEMKMGMTEPAIHVGSASNRLGRWVVGMAGGTNGGAGVAKAYYDAGISTVFYMHLAEKDKSELRSYEKSGNLVATGHIASDSVGISPFVKRLGEAGLEVTPMSGVYVPS